jgi:hypothetical protein
VGRIAIVQSVERVTDEGGKGVDVKVDGGANPTIVEHYTDPGDDSLPLPGDSAALEDSSGLGAEQATGYADTRSTGKARAGEKRIYARKPDGSVACDVWLKGDETIAISFGSGGSFECRANGDVVINGVVISKTGSVRAPGDVVALAATELTAVHLATHTHASVGSPPTPGT